MVCARSARLRGRGTALGWRKSQRRLISPSFVDRPDRTQDDRGMAGCADVKEAIAMIDTYVAHPAKGD